MRETAGGSAGGLKYVQTVHPVKTFATLSLAHRSWRSLERVGATASRGDEMQLGRWTLPPPGS